MTPTFTCQNCDKTLTVTDKQPVKVGAMLDGADYDLWCAECAERDL